MTRTRSDEANSCGGSRAKCDPVAEAGVESFPASDPPVWTEGRRPDPAKAAAGCCCGRPPAKT